MNIINPYPPDSKTTITNVAIDRMIKQIDRNQHTIVIINPICPLAKYQRIIRSLDHFDIVVDCNQRIDHKQTVEWLIKQKINNVGISINPADRSAIDAIAYYRANNIAVTIIIDLTNDNATTIINHNDILNELSDYIIVLQRLSNRQIIDRMIGDMLCVLYDHNHNVITVDQVINQTYVDDSITLYTTNHVIKINDELDDDAFTLNKRCLKCYYRNRCKRRRIRDFAKSRDCYVRIVLDYTKDDRLF